MRNLLFVLMCVLTCACSSVKETEPDVTSSTTDPNTRQVTFKVGMDTNYAPITRGSTDLASVISRLDVILNNTSSHIEMSKSWRNDAANFGTFTLGLTVGNHNVTAIGSTGEPTLANGMLSYPDNKVMDTFFFFVNSFNPMNTTTLNIPLKRIVGMFVLKLSDLNVPSLVTKIKITHSGCIRYNVTAGGPDTSVAETHTEEYTDFTSKEFRFLCFSNAQTQTTAQYAQKITVTVDALDANDNIIETRTFTDVPMRNNYKTTYTGYLFSDYYAGFNVTIDNNWGPGYTDTF